MYKGSRPAPKPLHPTPNRAVFAGIVNCVYF